MLSVVPYLIFLLLSRKKRIVMIHEKVLFDHLVSNRYILTMLLVLAKQFTVYNQITTFNQKEGEKFWVIIVIIIWLHRGIYCVNVYISVYCLDLQVTQTNRFFLGKSDSSRWGCLKHIR